MLGLLTGPQALKDDMSVLERSGGLAGFPRLRRQQSVGVFGILLGNLFVWLLGLSFPSWFVIIGIIALQYSGSDAPKPVKSPARPDRDLPTANPVFLS